MLFYEKKDNEKDEWLLFFNSSINEIEIFDNQLALLSREYNIILIDLPGIGANRECSDTFTYDSIIQDINNILAKLGITKVNIVGVSLGSIVAAKYLIKCPERVNKIVFAEFMTNFSNKFKSLILWKFSKMKRILPKKMYLKLFIKTMLPGKKNKVYREMLLKNTLNMKKSQLYTWIELVYSYFSNYEKSIAKELASINIPKLYIAGKKDKAFIKKIKKNIVENEHNKLVTIENAGHLCHIQEEKIFVKNILNFFSKK